jgi:hypothetical protein
MFPTRTVTARRAREVGQRLVTVAAGVAACRVTGVGDMAGIVDADQLRIGAGPIWLVVPWARLWPYPLVARTTAAR